jgi:hypothetical protein
LTDVRDEFIVRVIFLDFCGSKNNMNNTLVLLNICGKDPAQVEPHACFD